MKYILAVSGGIDSVVLLDILMNNSVVDNNKIIIAHFNHGIRKESKRDAEFVRSLAKKYDLPFELGVAKLGKTTNEESARNARYKFLRDLSAKYNSAKIITAHHQDDLVETIVMNIIRGTSWRGLSPFWSDDIIRPMIKMNKVEITRYAIEHDLEWVEDETNFSPKYFRNRIRFALDNISQLQKSKLIDLYNKQKNLRTEIEEILSSVPNLALEPDTAINTEQFSKLDNNIATEMLNKVTNDQLTNPQLERLLKFIKTDKSGNICQPGGGLQVAIYKNQFTITKL